jgi:hypothetical protein
MRKYIKTFLFATLFTLLLALDALVANVGLGITAERVSLAKIITALSLQVAAALLFAFFVQEPRKTDLSIRLMDQIKAWLTPYIILGVTVAFTLSLLYNAVACGEQSFIHSRKGEPICKLEIKERRCNLNLSTSECPNTTNSIAPQVINTPDRAEKYPKTWNLSISTPKTT